MLNVEMLSTGDEVLHGQIVDTNAAWLADFFFHQGVPLSRRNTVGDNLDSLVAILRERSQHADVLIVNGGLGPTSDDLSALAAATAKGEGLVLHQAWLTEMERYFQQRGRVMAPSNRKQAELPASAEFINNPVGTACGFALQLNRCLMFFTPGVPSEFKVMVEKEILPRLRARFSLPEPPLCLRLTTFGRSESDLAQRLDSLPLPPGVTMGYRSSMPIIELKLTGPATQREAMLALWPEVKRVAGQNLIFEGTENEHLNFALATPDGTYALRVRFSANRYSLAIRQEVCAMMALNMLRRWLNGEDITSEHGWIDVVESLTS
ncbi:nicotinamide mononucleotide deamidase-related protein YfaY [Salmonella enterica]|nr:nicotinamide mononucleotide deamidase-related protein YfaY [Salmonella enterica]EDO1757171.1 nicotinamide mononucleotide deamidase-related protein YfaY [Salmonella enterica]